MGPAWQPGADSSTLAARAALLRGIRAFFDERGVLEVTTPLLGGVGVSDVHINNVSAAGGARDYFLQTSPEYAMKRLLAAGSGPIYQLAPAVRGGESGVRHNIEFTLLEWYRPGFGSGELMSEVESLVCRVVGLDDGFECRRYKDLFISRFGVDPHAASIAELQSVAAREFADEVSHIVDHRDDATRNDYLDLMFSTGIERSLEVPVFVTDYPATQAALARTGSDADGAVVARRFELFWRGTEIANGYRELTDAAELRRRIEDNNAMRERRGLPRMDADEKLLAALPHIPECAGVALGVDRLLMLMLGKGNLDEVLAFSESRL